MLSIGDFARHGRVSVRMLRHIDLNGYCSAGDHRELYLAADPAGWVTVLQEPLADDGQWTYR